MAFQMRARNIFAVVFVALIVGSAVCGCGGKRGEKGPAEEKKDTVYPLGFLTDTLEMVSGAVRDGEYFSTLLSGLGMPAGRAYALQQACGSEFNPAKIVSGKKYDAYYTADSLRQLHYLVYHHSFRRSTIFRCFDSLAVWNIEKPVVRQIKTADVTIRNSLFVDMDAAGYPIEASIQLEDVFQWTVDFFALYEGDRFRMVYDEVSCDGKVIDIDTVYYAICDHHGKQYKAIRYDTGDGGNIYWSEKGESLRKAFLKAPLHFSRISSGFTSHRLHPVTRKVQPHYGVDYAAPTGTPVRAIGDGTVISAGYNGAAGNMVKIRHSNGYMSGYLHLSRYGAGVKTGAHVSQGQVIGYVGSTGRSTGPHLDFRIWKNGSPLNPLKMESPSVAPIPSRYLPVLDSLDRYYSAQL